MARIVCYSVILLLSSVSLLCMDLNDIYNYVLLITDVHNYYRTACIVIVHSDSYTDFNETTPTHIFSRAFSRRGIYTVSISFSELSRETRKYQGYTVRPLYVALLTTKEIMDEFAMATGQIDISFPVWFVMFLPHHGRPMRTVCQNPIGNPFNLLFDTQMLVLCYDLPTLNEWYSLRDNRTRAFNLATWTPGRGFQLTTNDSFYARRSNLHGETLRVAFVEESLFVTMNDGILSQFFGGVIEELSKSMNFTMKVTGAAPAYGSWNEKKQLWTGVIGEVVSNDVDFGVAEFSMTNSRLNAVDFTLPLILSRNRVYFRKPDGSTSVQWSIYFKAFDVDIWSTIVCIIMSAPILLTLMKTRGRMVMKILTENCVHVWGIYCQQGLSEFPHETSLRLAFLSIFVSALIISSAYSASLVSFLTVSTVSLPFTTLEDFAGHGSYRLITFKNSADYDLIVSAKDKVFRKLKKLLKDENRLPLTVFEGFDQVCSEDVGFYVTEAIKNAMNAVPCEVVYIEADRIDSLAMALRKGSPYTGVVNYHLQRFKDNGVLNRIRHAYIVTTTPSNTGYVPVTLESIASILSVLAGGIVLGGFILMLEKMYYSFWEDEYGKTCRFVRKLKTFRAKRESTSQRKDEYRQKPAIVYYP